MVIPCYNKEKYITNMFDSILVQEWDNIEIILVNDGSTDTTRDIISEYEPKFRSRGFDVLIVDQENRGVAAAVYEGLKRVTGEYVCQVDADDELDPKYVSTLAGWLYENSEYEWVVCDVLNIVGTKEEHRNYFKSIVSEFRDLSNIIELFLLSKIVRYNHEYMVRTYYLKKAEVVERFHYELRKTQQPQFIFPLASAGGKLKHIPLPLYRYAQNETSISNKQTFKEHMEYYRVKNLIIENAIKSLNSDYVNIDRLLAILEVSRYARFYNISVAYEPINEDSTKENALSLINSLFTPSPNLTADVFNESPYILFTAIVDNILGARPKNNMDGKRIIAWGAKGRIGKVLLEYLNGTRLEPDLLWDSKGDGVTVTKPNIDDLSVNDVVFILPVRQSVALEIANEIKNTGCTIVMFDELKTHIASLKYPQFYDGTLKFIHERKNNG
jgi:glycosyltransferase involved in cell wall biosynthesis